MTGKGGMKNEDVATMVARIDERTRGTDDRTKLLASQHEELSRKMSEQTRDLHLKLDKHFVRKETHKAEMAGTRRWLGYITTALIGTATAVVASFIKGS
jgi:hypothetical protein